MKSITLPILFLLILGFSTAAQDRQKELDSLITYANTLASDTLKVKLLARIHERMMFKDNEQALVYAQKAFELSKQIGYKKGVATGYQQFGNYYFNQSKNDSASYYHKLALAAYKDAKSVRGQIFALHSLATLQKENGNFDEAIELTRSILNMYTEYNRKNSDLGSFDLRGSEYEVLGDIYIEKGSYRLALDNTLKALRFFEEVEDEVRTADALKQLADIEYLQANYRKSLEYAERAIAIYKKNDDKIYEGYAAQSAGDAAERLNEGDLSEQYQRRAMDLGKAMNMQSLLVKASASLARLLYQREKFPEARKLLKEALKITEEQDIKSDRAVVLTELSNLDILRQRPTQALTYINEVIATSEEIGALPYLRDALNIRAKIRETMNLPELALKDYKQFKELNDSLYNIRKSQQIEELVTIYGTEKKEAEIALKREEIKTLNEVAKVDKLKKNLYAGGMVSAIMLSGLLVFGFRQRMKKNRIEREKQEQIHRQELAHKKKELASQTLHLVQKNTFIQELMDNLQNIKNSPERFKVEFRRIVMLLKKENASDKDWEAFKTYFSEVHNDFDQKLKTLYTDISEKEIRLAAFLRMNLTTKEIAATLNVLPDSILKSKYRLKKKMGLGRDIDLTGFLNTL